MHQKYNNKIATWNYNHYPLLLSMAIIIGISLLVFSTPLLLNFIPINNDALALVNNNPISSSSNIINSSDISSSNNANVNTNNDNSADIPNAKSVLDTGKMALPPSVKGFIINLPDETHEKDDTGKAISPANAHYLPSNLAIPSGSAIVFVQGDPNHIHSEVVTNDNSNSVVWKTIPINHPGATDDKILPPGSYSISDAKYPAMKGKITVDSNTKSSGNLVVGAFFVPTGSLEQYKSGFQSSGFQILSTHDFVSGATKQKDISGPTTLIVYSTTMNLDDAKSKLLPILNLLPYL